MVLLFLYLDIVRKEPTMSIFKSLESRRSEHPEALDIFGLDAVPNFQELRILDAWTAQNSGKNRKPI